MVYYGWHRFARATSEPQGQRLGLVLAAAALSMFVINP